MYITYLRNAQNSHYLFPEKRVEKQKQMWFRRSYDFDFYPICKSHLFYRKENMDLRHVAIPIKQSFYLKISLSVCIEYDFSCPLIP